MTYSIMPHATALPDSVNALPEITVMLRPNQVPFLIKDRQIVSAFKTATRLVDKIGVSTLVMTSQNAVGHSAPANTEYRCSKKLKR
jgi:hypothetical protein